MKTVLLIALASIACSGDAPNRRIAIHLYNLSGIPADTLNRATHEASRIFVKQDVTINWTLGEPDAEEARFTDQSAPAAFRDAHVRPWLVVRIGRGLAFKVPDTSLGYALPRAQFGVSVTIFQERIESMCQGAGHDFPLMLGHAIAHEIGHVTLASNAHSPKGIMRARWGKADLGEAATGHLGFTPQQGIKIRDYASRAAFTSAVPLKSRDTNQTMLIVIKRLTR